MIAVPKHPSVRPSVRLLIVNLVAGSSSPVAEERPAVPCPRVRSCLLPPAQSPPGSSDQPPLPRLTPPQSTPSSPSLSKDSWSCEPSSSSDLT
ncbi:UNVERIFIED_CONTAM: hypothetical protein FKN15_067414 [Acipenser sinensis]